MQFKNNKFDLKNNIYIMAILNVTPDSFSDGGKFNNIDNALFQTEKMIKEGAHIIDIGGESTRPFSEPVPLNEELDRVIPVIEKINNNFNTVISIDTYKSEVAEEALKNGAEIINDISGFTFDKNMVKIAGKYQAVSIIMHIKGTPKNMQVDPYYKNLLNEVYLFFKKQIKLLKKNNIKDIIIDPGFGFGKSLDDNYKLLKNLNKFKKLKCPILAGISRKSMIGKVLNNEPVDRLTGTLALNTIALIKGAKILRVHDIMEHLELKKIIEKYLSF